VLERHRFVLCWCDGVLLDYMEPISQSKWLLARLLAIVFNTIAIMSIPVEQSNVDWLACFLISAISSASLFLWLTMIRSRQDIDWFAPYSLWQPFLPMKQYPLRFWFLTSYSLVIAGIAATIRNMTLHRRPEAVCATFVFMGLFISTALRLWIRNFQQPE
jgi:hypothetical protein